MFDELFKAIMEDLPGYLSAIFAGVVLLIMFRDKLVAFRRRIKPFKVMLSTDPPYSKFPPYDSLRKKLLVPFGEELFIYVSSNINCSLDAVKVFFREPDFITKKPVDPEKISVERIDTYFPSTKTSDYQHSRHPGYQEGSSEIRFRTLHPEIKIKGRFAVGVDFNRSVFQPAFEGLIGIQITSNQAPQKALYRRVIIEPGPPSEDPS